MSNELLDYLGSLDRTMTPMPDATAGFFEFSAWMATPTEYSEEIDRIEALILRGEPHPEMVVIERSIYPDWDDRGQHNSFAIVEFRNKKYKIKFNYDSWDEMGIPAIDWKNVEELS